MIDRIIDDEKRRFVVDRIVDDIFTDDLTIDRFVVDVDKREIVDFVVSYRIKCLFSRLFVLKIFKRWS